MWCPQCRTEYRDDVRVCSECGAALLPGPPPEVHDAAEWVDLVTVLVSADPAILTMARSVLASHGIECVDRGETLQSVFGVGGLPGQLGGPIQLQVKLENEEAARALLAAEDSVPETPPGSD